MITLAGHGKDPRLVQTELPLVPNVGDRIRENLNPKDGSYHLDSLIREGLFVEEVVRGQESKYWIVEMFVKDGTVRNYFSPCDCEIIERAAAPVLVEKSKLEIVQPDLGQEVPNVGDRIRRSDGEVGIFDSESYSKGKREWWVTLKSSVAVPFNPEDCEVIERAIAPVLVEKEISDSLPEQSLKVGDRVYQGNPDNTGIVTKISRGKAVVDIGGDREVKVPLERLHHCDPNYSPKPQKTAEEILAEEDAAIARAREEYLKSLVSPVAESVLVEESEPVLVEVVGREILLPFDYEIPEKEKGDENYTPDYFVEACRNFLGWFDLDPFSNAIAQKSIRAKTFWTKADNALTKDWTPYEKKIVNPPYSQGLIGKCIDKILEFCAIGETILVVNSSTSAKWFQRCKNACSAYLNPSKRMPFYNPYREIQYLNGTKKRSGNEYDQTVFYLGTRPLEFAQAMEHLGSCSIPIKKSVLVESPVLVEGDRVLIDNGEFGVDTATITASSPRISKDFVTIETSNGDIEVIKASVLIESKSVLVEDFAIGQFVDTNHCGKNLEIIEINGDWLRCKNKQDQKFFINRKDCSLTTTGLEALEPSVMQPESPARSKQSATLTSAKMRKQCTVQTSPKSQSLETLEKLSRQQELICTQGDSPVQEPQTQGQKQDLNILSLPYGLNTSELLQRDNLGSLSLRILPQLSIADYEQYLEDSEWSDIVGMIRKSYKQLSLEVPKSGKDCLSLPTLTTNKGVKSRSSGQSKCEKWFRDNGLLQDTQCLSPQMMAVIFGFPSEWTKCLWDAQEEVKEESDRDISLGEPSTLIAPPLSLKEFCTSIAASVLGVNDSSLDDRLAHLQAERDRTHPQKTKQVSSSGYVYPDKPSESREWFEDYTNRKDQERLCFLQSERDRLIASGASPKGVWLEKSKPARKDFVQVVWKSDTPHPWLSGKKSQYIGKENSDEHTSAIAIHQAGQQLRIIEREIKKLEKKLSKKSFIA